MLPTPPRGQTTQRGRQKSTCVRGGTLSSKPCRGDELEFRVGELGVRSQELELSFNAETRNRRASGARDS